MKKTSILNLKFKPGDKIYTIAFNGVDVSCKTVVKRFWDSYYGWCYKLNGGTFHPARTEPYSSFDEKIYSLDQIKKYLKTKLRNINKQLESL